MTQPFTPEESSRYARHFALPNVGVSGQQRLKQAKVLCIGAGGLGAPVLLYLAAAGIGTLGIIDDDHVELSNLQRQILYSSADLQQPKSKMASERLRALNPQVNIIDYATRFDHTNAVELVADYDIVIDGSDNFTTRYLAADTCYRLRKPYVYASVLQFQGQCAVFLPDGPCYRCLFATPPAKIPNCADAGVLGPLPGILGSVQALETLKLILGIGTSLQGKVLLVDALSLQFQTLSLPRDPNCALCGTQPHQETQTMKPIQHITAQQLQELQQQTSDFILLDVREPEEYAVANLGGKLIPLDQLSERLDELNKEKLIVVHCKAGPRSEHAAFLLQQAGFDQVQVLQGGILAAYPSPPVGEGARRADEG